MIKCLFDFLYQRYGGINKKDEAERAKYTSFGVVDEANNLFYNFYAFVAEWRHHIEQYRFYFVVNTKAFEYRKA